MLFVELAVLIAVLLIGLSIVWSTLRTGMSPMMSSNKACQAMLAEISPSIDGPVIDLGSGWGTLVVAAAHKYPNQQVIGYELSWLPWLVSLIRKHRLGLSNLTLYRKNYQQADLGKASTLFCYLFPKAMNSLHEKLQLELANGTRIVSNTFALPSCEPTRVIRLKDFYQSPIYVYDWQTKL